MTSVPKMFQTVSLDEAVTRRWDVVVAGTSFAAMFFARGPDIGVPVATAWSTSGDRAICFTNGVCPINFYEMPRGNHLSAHFLA